ncbi:hypothetical protein B0H10DRAFT_1957238 [Mycena sp. CBHHK59/15]|nr:hypothetical protein B0H10DRAFT_1957238 [Mycena sp. CBHHK59/15]
MPIVQCQYCKLPFKDETILVRHQAHAPACKKKRDEYIVSSLLVRRRRCPRSPPPAAVVDDAPEPADPPSAGDDFMDVDGPEEPVAPSPETLDVDAQDPPPSVAKPAPAGVAGGEGGSEEPFDSERRAGATYGHSKTMFEHIRDDQILTVLGPFADEENGNWRSRDGRDPAGTHIREHSTFSSEAAHSLKPGTFTSLCAVFEVKAGTFRQSS